MDSFTSLNFLDTRSVLLGVAVFLVIYRLLGRRATHNLPPGPRGWPLLGYLPQLASTSEDPHVVFSKLAKKYGNIISLDLAGTVLIVLHGHDTIKAAFNLHQLTARPPFYVSENLRQGVGIIGSSGENWTEIRRFSLTVLRGFGVGKSSFEENIAMEAKFLIEEWKKIDGAPFDPRHLIACSVSNVICSVVVGKRFHYMDKMLENLLQYSDDVMDQVGAGGAIEFSSFLARLTFFPSIKRYVETVRRFNQQVTMLIDEHGWDYDPDNLRDLIDTFLKHKETKETTGGESKVFQKDNMRKVVGDLFIAGSETTATTLRWSILYMMAYPEVQARVQKELDDVTGRNRFPRMSDKPDLPYTEAVICEIQRISTIVPLAVPHYSTEDITFQGFTIPKGSLVLSNLWHNHFDPAVWKDPQTFRPERFLDAKGKLRSREELTTFGIGRRICLGEHLARMELFIFFTLFLHEFTFKNPPNAPPVTLEGVNAATWAPKNFKACAIPRQ